MKYIIAVLSCLCIATGSLGGQSGSGSFSHEGIIQEITRLRATEYRFKKGVNTLAAHLLNAVDQELVIEQEPFWIEQFKKGYLFADLSKLQGVLRGMVMLTPERAPETYALVKSVADKLELSVPLLYLCKNEEIFNAFAVGFFQTASAVIFGEKVLKTTNMAELEFLIAHELSHIKKRHNFKKRSLGLLYASAMLGVNATLYFSGLLQNKAGLAALSISEIWAFAFIKSAYSRSYEREADLLAVQTVGTAGASFLEKLKENDPESNLEEDFMYLQQEIDNFSLGNKRNLQVNAVLAKKIAPALERFFSLLRTHPTPNQRIQALQNL